MNHFLKTTFFFIILFFLIGFSQTVNAKCTVDFDKSSYNLGDTMTINYANAPASASLSLSDPVGTTVKNWTVSGSGSKTWLADSVGNWLITLTGTGCNTWKSVTVSAPPPPLPPPPVGFCQGPIVPCGGASNPCEFCHIFVLINNIINFILTCLTPIAAGLMMVIGGFYFLAAGPSPGKVTQAKSVITAAVIGLVIVFIAWVFLNTFLDMIGVATWTGLENWWEISCP